MWMSNQFKEYIKKECKKCEKFLKNVNAFDKIPSIRDTDIPVCYKKLAAIYRYFDDISNSKKMCELLTNIGAGIKKSKFVIIHLNLIKSDKRRN